MIRILIVDDSLLVAKVIQAVLESDPAIQVVGIAKDGLEAIRMTQKLKPNLITLDIYMPNMDGVEATKQIMADSPTPILILTSSVRRGKEEGKVFQALSYGALEVMEKNVLEKAQINEKDKSTLIEKVKFLSQIVVITHLLGKIEREQEGNKLNLPFPKESSKEKIIGIVASTGGPQAVLSILENLPKKFPVPILMVQHISAGFEDGFSNWLGEQISLPIKVAEPGELIKSGTIYVAPHDFHMKVTRERRIFLTDTEPPVSRERPSGTVLFSSIAEVYGRNGLGILLTGMGQDGAEGLKKMHEAHAHTIAQDEATSVIYGMPKAAVEMKAVDEVLPLQEIAEKMIQWTSR